VVDVAAVRRLRAAGEPAAAVAGEQVVDQRLGWGVAGAAVVQQVPVDRVGDQPPPLAVGGQRPGGGGRDGPVPGQLARGLGQPEQAGQVDGDPDLRALPVRAGQGGLGQRGGGERDQRVGPAGVDARRVGRVDPGRVGAGRVGGRVGAGGPGQGV
jgi:hypothetical protein